MIDNNVESNFNVTALAKLVTLIAVVEELQPGSINFIVQTAAFLADDWKMKRSVNNVDAAKTLFKEFEEWLRTADNQLANQPSNTGFTEI